MLLKTLSIANDVVNDGSLHEQLSLKTFVHYLKKANHPSNGHNTIPKFALDIIEKMIGTQGDINEDNLDKFVSIFEIIFHLTKGIPQSDEIPWSMAFPAADKIFFGTKTFYDLTDKDLSLLPPSPYSNVLDLSVPNKLLYLYILEKLYHVPKIDSKLLYEKKTEGLSRYYKLHVDFTFVEVQPIGRLPKLNLSFLKNKDMMTSDNVIEIFQSIDLNNFIFKGFSICYFTDYQESYISESLQGLINNMSIYKGKDGLTSLNKILSDIVYYEGVSSSFFPLLRLNGFPLFSPELVMNSILFGDLIVYDKDHVRSALFRYLENPYILSFGVEEWLDSTDSVLQEAIDRANIHSYICFPLKHNGELVGFYEIYSQNQPLKKIKIQPYFALLAQLANEIVLNFKSELNDIILHHYTSLQPAVEWRFNQVAAQYLGDMIRNEQEPELEKIVFKEVYPFYGAVDIKDSTIWRNRAYRDDILLRIEMINQFVQNLEEQSVYLDDEIFLEQFKQVKLWTVGAEVDQFLLDILSFFSEDVPIFLQKIKDDFPQVYILVQHFSQKFTHAYVNPNSKIFDQSMHKINELIKKELDTFNHTVQHVFPSYFETFRTDGIEYDLYVGQAIAPMRAFDKTVLQYIQQQQIISMARIGKAAYQLKDELQISLETTQLIFIHPTDIDISFREDEKRFDVEGNYNIRYQIIKKRIDKALIRGTADRLVQPGSIAIVYSREIAASLLRSQLEDIARLGWISPEIEELHLENLQGVNELKALRVQII